MDKYDVAILGAGPGGYVAAIRAAQNGLKTVVIEAQHLGGVCLNWGCIPTKALLRTAEIHELLHHLDKFGLSVKDISFDFDKVIARSRKVAERLSKGIQHLLKKHKVTVIDGYGRLNKNKTIDIEVDKGATKSVQAKLIIIATGAKPRPLPHVPFDQKLVWSSKEAMLPDTLPKRLLVVGSGAIGIEFASFYAALGVEVSVVEIQKRILLQEDEEIAAVARKAFEARGIKFYTETTLENVKLNKDSVEVTLKHAKGAENHTFDRVIVAAGIQANIEDIGLKNTAVKTDKNLIQVNGFCETADKGIYAIGDVIRGPWLAHKASHEGILAIDHILGKKGLHEIDRKDIPGCTYATPQIASVGYTEAQAIEAGFDVKVGRFPFMANGKAIAMGEEDGLVKTVFDAKTGELLGAHLVGAEVTEMIQGFVIARKLETTEQELMDTIFPHPTLSEMMHESVLDAHDKAIHI